MIRSMKKHILISLFALLIVGAAHAQITELDAIKFLNGNWVGRQKGLTSKESKVTVNFKSLMNEHFLKMHLKTEFRPAENPKQVDKSEGISYISFDLTKKKIVIREFKDDGTITKLEQKLETSTDAKFSFVSEYIENFSPGSKAELVINKLSDKKITITKVLIFPGGSHTASESYELIKK